MSDISSSHQTRITFENLIICPPTVIVSEANNEVDDSLCYILGHDPQSNSCSLLCIKRSILVAASGTYDFFDPPAEETKGISGKGFIYKLPMESRDSIWVEEITLFEHNVSVPTEMEIIYHMREGPIAQTTRSEGQGTLIADHSDLDAETQFVLDDEGNKQGYKEADVI